MKRQVLSTIREWMFPVAVILFWALGTSYTLARLGEAHQAHQEAAAARVTAPEPASAAPVLARAE
jgi:hypothetical protein